MVDLNVLDAILSARNGVWATFLLLCILAWRGWTGLPAVMQQWVERRRAIAAEKAADWERLREEVRRYSERLTTVEQHDQDCQRQLRDALGRLAEVEGFMMGQGKARQDAANIVAIERLTDRENGDKDTGK